MSHFSCLVIHEEGADLDEILEPWMENCCGTPSYEYMEFYPDDDCEVDDAKGVRGYWQNPEARWDWWTDDPEWSRFARALRLKDGTRANKARVGDIDVEPDPAAYDRALAWWRKAIERKGLEKGEEPPFVFPSEEFYRERYPEGAEQYARAQSLFATYAVVKDGEWHEQGRMGWWGISNEAPGDERAWREAFCERFLVGVEPDMRATVVDCHI